MFIRVCMLLACLGFPFPSLYASHLDGPLYQVNYAPLEARPQLAKRYDELRTLFDQRALSPAEHLERMGIVQTVLHEDPEWMDGYWLVATESFLAGSGYPAPADHPKARRIFKQGLETIELCMKKFPGQTLCKFFYASILAKIASIDGVFASLKYGKTVLTNWLEVAKTPIDIAFRPNVSLQGSSYYGLGLFYRLVPDSLFLRWLWGIQGNIDESIRYHRKALAHDHDNPCAQMMLAVSLLCKVKGKEGTDNFKEAMGLLDQAAKLPPTDLAQAVCIHDVPLIRSEPKKTCGYTQAKYQDDLTADQIRKSKS